jgi:isopentenyl-diphosphate delta-isomerase
MKNNIIQRKKDHINLCLNEDVAFKQKTNGFENYDFEHYAITEVELDRIDLSTSFFSKKISYPFLISCMTGGTSEAKKLNEKLAIAANQLNIPIGVGSQRQALESKTYHNTYKVVRKNAANVPVLGNLGAAEIAKSKNVVDDVNKLINLIEADAFVIHFNPLQELLQKEGQPDFKGLLKNIERLTSKIKIPFIAKEVGSGISKESAEKLLSAGIVGIDVAGSGGTSWGKVELLRNNSDDHFFSEWGLPTSYCIRTVNELKKNYKFVLVSSGGINNFDEIAKSLVMGADLVGSARKILLEVNSKGIDGVIQLVQDWFEAVKKIMYLTGSKDIKSFQKKKLIRKTELL